MQTRFISTLFLSVIATTACKAPNPAFNNDEVGEDVSTPGEEGTWWCATFPDAEAYYSLVPPGAPQPITTFETTGDPPSACRCAHPDLHEFFEGRLDQGILRIDAETQNDWDELDIGGQSPVYFREAVFHDLSYGSCEFLADEYHDQRVDDNCQSYFTLSIDDEIAFTLDNDPCFQWETYGEQPDMVPLPEDGWSDYFTLNTAITYSSGLNLYTIDGAFFNSMLQTPAWIIEDGVYVDLNINDDYQIYNVTAGTIAYALGLQSGDIPQTLNSIDITTMAGVMEAWLNLQEETEFELVVLRGVNTVTLDYQVVYMAP